MAWIPGSHGLAARRGVALARARRRQGADPGGITAAEPMQFRFQFRFLGPGAARRGDQSHGDNVSGFAMDSRGSARWCAQLLWRARRCLV